MTEVEGKLKALLSGPAGKSKVANIIEPILYYKAPAFIRNIKSREDLYYETKAASQVIVEEEVAKGENDLYNRIKNRIDTYWEVSMS